MKKIMILQAALVMLLTAFFANSGFAQSNNPQLYGIWQLDSISDKGMLGKEFNKVRKKELGDIYLVFRKNNTFSFAFGEKSLSDSFTVWQSGKRQAISIFKFMLEINRLDARSLQFDMEGLAMIMMLDAKIYLSRRQEMNLYALEKNLAGMWKNEGRISESKVEVFHFPVVSQDDLSLLLDSNGRAGYYMGGTKQDTGTWKFDPENFQLIFKGKKATRQFRILLTDNKELSIAPADGSVMYVMKRQKWPAEVAAQKDDIMLEFDEDAVTVETMEEPMTVVEEDAAMEAPAKRSLYTDNYSTLEKSWDAVYELNEYREKDSSVGKRRVVFMKNGYFELHEGRKKTTGKWKINTNEGILLLTLKKREYIASYRFDYDYYARRRDPQAPNQYLIISMVWPGEKEVRSIAFAPVKL